MEQDQGSLGASAPSCGSPAVCEPWAVEPDLIDWTDEATGLSCLIRRGPTGALCGYVRIPEGHVAQGLDYSFSGYSAESVLDGSAAKTARAQKAIDQICVHGGLTFAGEFGDIEGYWFGFDCAHSGDFCPKYEKLSDLGRPTGWGGVVEYRDIAYVTAEVVSLARQLQDMAREGGEAVRTTPNPPHKGSAA